VDYIHVVKSGYPMLVDRRVFVPMEDGTRIAVTLYLPDAPADGPFPAVVESLPYRKDDDSNGRDHSTYAYLAARGIAGIRVDVRGTGASGGIIEDEYLAQEQRDNLEILAWAAGQEWCSGRLGMWGVSWGGFSALQTAMHRPQRLAAIAAVHATHDRFGCDVHYIGGSLHAAEQVEWPTMMLASNALPPDPDIVGGGWFEQWLDRLERTPYWPATWLRHQTRDAYWRHGSPGTDYSAIACPTLLVGGWLDGYVDGMLALTRHLTCPVRTVIGPWGHHRPATGVPGPTFDHLDLLARWFGHHLRGDDNDVMAMPRLTTFIRTEPPFDTGTVKGRWRAEASWPPADTESQTVPLSGLTHGRTTWSGPQWVGAHAPAWDRSGVESSDPTPDDRRSMTFETVPAASPVEILGSPVVQVRMTTDRSVGLVAGRLSVVQPDGRAHLICRGSRNLAFPLNLSSPSRPVPGVPIDIRLVLGATSCVVAGGSRLRLALAGADFPIVWPPPETFTLAIDPTASRLVLPLVPSRPASDWLDIPSAPPPPAAPIEPIDSDATWRVEDRDGATIFTRSTAVSELQPTRDRLVFDFDQSWSVSVDEDPSSTRASSKAVFRLARPGWRATTTATLAIAGGDPLELVIEVTADHGDQRIFSRRQVERIPRTWV
jgi:hypothetical protein